MIQFSYNLSRLVALINVVLCFAFLVVGTPVQAIIFGSSAIVMFLASFLFSRMEQLERVRNKQMQSTGDNDYDLNAEDEYEVLVEED